jgi:hypothetical protein
VRVYRLYYSDRPTVHEWKQARPESVFMCHECGRGCSSEREAEDRAARRKTDGQEAIAKDPFRLSTPAEFQESLRMPGGAKIVYWGATKWQEALAEQERRGPR